MTDSYSPSHPMSGNAAPQVPSTGPGDSGQERSRPDLGIVVASAWLVCSVIVGLWLMFSSHSIASNNVTVRHLPATNGQAYGGDAYTGIQNASADTANAVKALAEFDDANARIGRRVSERADIGIGFLVISIGVVNFNMALRRKSASPAETL